MGNTYTFSVHGGLDLLGVFDDQGDLRVTVTLLATIAKIGGTHLEESQHGIGASEVMLHTTTMRSSMIMSYRGKRSARERHVYKEERTLEWI